MSNELILLKRIENLEKLIHRIPEAPKPFLEDLRFPATPGLWNPVTAKPDYDYTNIGFLFDPDADESIYIIAQMPHDWVAGSTIYPHFHWMPTTTNTGDVVWAISYKWTNEGEADAGSVTYAQAVQAGGGTAYVHQRANVTSGIAGTGKTTSSILSIRCYRNADIASDTYTGDALLKEFDIHYLKDPLKSYWSGT